MQQRRVQARALHATWQEYFAAENYEKARVEFGNALQINPKDAEARYMSGRVAEKLGKIRDAVGGYQAAIESNSDHTQARANLGRVFVFAGVQSRRWRRLSRAAKHPDDPDLLTRTRSGADTTQGQAGSAGRCRKGGETGTGQRERRCAARLPLQPVR